MIPAWHGCMLHNRNHCPECKTCSHHDEADMARAVQLVKVILHGVPV